ncbi:MAG: FtsW/RodA/SpoVE family cell cycle protein [Nitriliruptorales bacterium]|nr:FtsW/RodA/SpoVE family cell cycle protein [Nitriliruptorales bacterium]
MSTADTLSSAGRDRERRLLLLGFLIVVGAYTVLGWSRSSAVPFGTVTYGAALAILGVAAHFAVRRWAPYADPLLLPCAYLLNGLGLVFIRRVDFAEGSNLAVTQTTWTVVGIALFAATLLILDDYRSLSRYAYTFGLATLVLLLLPLFPVIGKEVNGARLWVEIGPLNFQPGEIAKLTIVVFLAAYLERKRTLLSVATHRVGPLLLPEPRHLAPVLAAAGAALLILVAQRDLGSSLLFFGVFIAMLYMATGRLAYPAVGLTAFAGGAFVAYHLFDHVRRRFLIWIDPWSRIDDAGYQLAQTTFALGTGGLTGTGLGLGRPDDIPFAATDAVFAVVGEELGLLGGTAVLLVFLLIVARGFKTALTARDELGTLLAAGLTFTLGLQVFVIIGGVTRLVPFTGITLPFVSYGGSSLIANYVLLALLIVISHRSRAVLLGADASRGKKGGS